MIPDLPARDFNSLASSPTSRVRRFAAPALLGFHALVLGSVLLAPGSALLAAFRAVGADSSGESIASLVDVGRWAHLLGSTVVVCATAVAVATTIGLVGGFLLWRTDLPGKSVLRGGVLFAACVPVYVGSIFVFAALPASAITESVFAESPFAVSVLACGVLYGLFYSPLAIVVLGAVLRAADRECEELALLDAGAWRVVRRVTVRQAGWGVAAFGILTILLVATDFTISDLLFVRTFAEEVNTQYVLHRSIAGPVLTSVPMMIGLAAMFVFAQVRYRLIGEHSARSIAAEPWIVSLGRFRWLALIVIAIVAAMVTAPPVAAVLGHVGSVTRFIHRALPLQRELLSSALLAAVASAFIVFVSVGLAWMLVRTRVTRYLVAIGVIVLLAVPAPVVGISLKELFNRPGVLGAVHDSPGMVVIGYVVRFLPVGVLLAAAAVRRVPRELEDASRLDGCDWLGVQTHVYWPAVARDMLLIGLVLLILCFAEVGATKFLVPPGWDTAAVRAFTLMHARVDSNLSVLAILSVCYILAPWAALAWLLRRRLGENARHATADGENLR